MTTPTQRGIQTLIEKDELYKGSIGWLKRSIMIQAQSLGIILEPMLGMKAILERVRR